MNPTAVSIVIAVVVLMGCTEGQRAVMSGLKPYRFPTTSMEPTITNGEQVFVERHEGYRPSRGHIVVFRYPLEPSTEMAKRVIALPGETIEIRAKRMYINGQSVRESYTVHRDARTYSDRSLPEPYRSRDHFGPLRMKQDEYFVLGDNRDSSADSRFWGPIPGEYIVGRVVKADHPNGPLRPVR